MAFLRSNLNFLLKVLSLAILLMIGINLPKEQEASTKTENLIQEDDIPVARKILDPGNVSISGLSIE